MHLDGQADKVRGSGIVLLARALMNEPADGCAVGIPDLEPSADAVRAGLGGDDDPAARQF